MNERMQLWFSRKHRRRRARAETAETGGGVPPAAVAPAGTTKRGGRWRVGLVLLLCLVGSAAVSFVVFKSVLGPDVPPELVGTWKVTKGKLKGAALEFRADGQAIATLVHRGKKEVTHSTVKVEGKKVSLTTRDDLTGKTETVIQTIVELTDDDLVIRDEDQVNYHLKRVSP